MTDERRGPDAVWVLGTPDFGTEAMFPYDVSEYFLVETMPAPGETAQRDPSIGRGLLARRP
jgi:hypothetical protein